MIMKQRLEILQKLMDVCSLKLRVDFVPSEKNKADVLTRVKKAWLGVPHEEEEEAELCCVGVPSVRELHQMHHIGRKVDPAVARKKVRQMVRQCDRCQLIDPAPSVHESGGIRMDRCWKRLAVDVMHYHHGLYLSMMDCDWIAIWRGLWLESVEEISKVLHEIFLDWGPVDEVLMDNGAAFQSQALKDMLNKLNVRRYFRAAYRPSRNGIVERHYRTIKAMAERGQVTPMEAVFWYNMSPGSGQDEKSVPLGAVFRYEWRLPRKVLLYTGEGEGSTYIRVEGGVQLSGKEAQ